MKYILLLFSFCFKATEHSGPSKTLNHQQQVIEILSNLYNKAEFSDVEIVVNGSLRVNAHKLLLISQSSVFSTMLSSERWADSKQKTINLVEDDQCLPHFEDFLKYFYTGSITIDTRNAFPVHCLADKYHVSNLKQSCEQFMLKNVAAPGEFNRAISWRKYSKLANLKKLEEDCDKFIAWNMNTIIQSPDWSTIDREHLLALLQRSDLVVESELSLLEAVVIWLGHQPTRIEEVLQHIRYPLIPPEEFFKFQASGSMDQAVCSFIFAKGVIAYQANSVSVETLKQSH
ncbi:BTB/POZ domain-containing protein 17-like isoform X1, partial [Acipenser oxyrinchus oxyrinchus]